MTAKKLHRDAMAKADEAFTAKRLGDTATAVSLFKKAHALEEQALALVPPNSLSFEVLSRSLQSLAKLAKIEGTK